MDERAKRRIVREMLDKLERDIFLAIEQMPGDWDKTELYLVRRAALLYIHRPSDHLRRMAYNNARCGPEAVTRAAVALAEATLSGLRSSHGHPWLLPG